MRILFGYDGSAYAKRALRYAKRLGADAEVAVITVAPVLIEAPRTEEFEDPGHDTREARRHLEDAQAILSEDGVTAELVAAVGNPAAEIIGAAEERGADLIVVGHRGRSAISRFIEGSVSDRVVRHASCDVLVVR
jgi:nucleotide-binding universal stress UspA family protein